MTIAWTILLVGLCTESNKCFDRSVSIESPEVEILKWREIEEGRYRHNIVFSA